MYLNPGYRRLLYNALSYLHFDYGCSSWFPLLKKKSKIKFQKVQNKCIPFSLNLPPKSHIDPSQLKRNLTTASDRVEKCIANTNFRYCNGITIFWVVLALLQ